MGAHTTSDDPTKYRDDEELDVLERTRPDRAASRRTCAAAGESDAFFAEVAAEADDLAADIRRRTLALEPPAGGNDVRARLHRAASRSMDAQQRSLARRLRGALVRGGATA